MGQNEAHGPKPSTKYTRSNYQVYQTQVWKYTEVKFQIKFLGYYNSPLLKRISSPEFN